MSWVNKNVNPNNLVKIGDEIEVMILEIDHAKRRISLGRKQCVENPWKIFADNNNKGDVVEGKIKISQTSVSLLNSQMTLTVLYIFQIFHGVNQVRKL